MPSITIKGRIPSKKNSTWTIMIKGRAIRLPSKKYQDWHKDASKQLIGCPKIDSQYIELFFTFPDKRKTDLTNKAESIMDCLVDNEILEDDNCTVVNKLLLQYMGVDKENPRCEIRW